MTRAQTRRKFAGWKLSSIGLLAVGCGVEPAEAVFPSDEAQEKLGRGVSPYESLQKQCVDFVSHEGLRRFNGWHDVLSPVHDGVTEVKAGQPNALGEVRGMQELFIGEDGEDKAGLSLVRGTWRINGLATYAGSAVHDGLPVNCHGKADDGCTGRPDGLLSAEGKGMLSQSQNSEQSTLEAPEGAGIRTARYLVNCALRAGQVIEVYDWNDERIRLEGQLGLCRKWATRTSSEGCERKVTACMLALSNGETENVEIELSSAIARIGPREHSADLPHYEASFYGNFFTRKTADDYPTAFACMGTDSFLPRIGERFDGQEGGSVFATGTPSWTTPVMITGYCHKKKAACESSDLGEWSRCKGANGKWYRHVISTHRRLDCENIPLPSAALAAIRCQKTGVDCEWDYPTGWRLAE